MKNEELERLARAWSHIMNMDIPEVDLVKRDLEHHRDLSSHVPGDSHTSAFNEGQRSLAVSILQLGDRFK